MSPVKLTDGKGRGGGAESYDGEKARYSNKNYPLKVVGNEKEGGSGRWQMIGIGLGPRR